MFYCKNYQGFRADSAEITLITKELALSFQMICSSRVSLIEWGQDDIPCPEETKFLESETARHTMADWQLWLPPSARNAQLRQNQLPKQKSWNMNTRGLSFVPRPTMSANQDRGSLVYNISL